jgi:CheY-like chemotaxis protein
VGAAAPDGSGRARRAVGQGAALSCETREAQMNDSHDTAAATAAARTDHILVFDDSAAHRALLETMLGGRYDVQVACDGEAAVEHVAASQPALVLLDTVTPGMDALAVCHALRSRPETRSMPIILVTSRDDEWDVEAGFASGCTDYVTKPVDPAELHAKVESWLAVARTGVAGE